MTAPATKMVKSAQRVMELLEFFTAERPEATVMDIVRVLDYPQSSASELLRCLVSLGYLSYDRYRRTYRPTTRVPLLGSWVLRSANWLSEEPACSNRVQKMIEATIRTRARISRWRSTRSSLVIMNQPR